jgi:hypothetical protein
VDGYFQGIVSGTTRMRPVPGSLAAALREKSDVALNDAGVKKALELARGRQAKADSAAASSAGAAPVVPATPPAAAPGTGS